MHGYEPNWNGQLIHLHAEQDDAMLTLLLELFLGPRSVISTTAADAGAPVGLLLLLTKDS